ncbi:54S ribosomal protein L4, mitochondrial [Pseudocercospora fuligena]|uniref:Large ribosomal subunit protein uL29m n=1 Tax=Pseudocercospora fuligena TaxID=685502 RepID=A0A8H6VF87_9PEZI|nr:54S ribosomal protein L4, mitochondrial [Pseudocercospora fuligena]
MHCTTKMLLSSAFAAPLARAASTTLPPSFLLPAFAAAQTQTSSFSTSSADYARSRPKRDRNPARGVSALRRTGLKKQKLSIGPEDLPKPVLDPARRSQVEVDENHGLWEFFPSDRKSMATPEEMNSHGRSWTVEELRVKDWDDLHRLWWACLKERNRLLTYANERKRVGNMYGAYESGERDKAIKRTMKSIKYVLTERWYSWENARVAAMQDPEINMYADLDAGEAAYLPKEDSFEPESQASADAEAQSGMPPPEPPKPEVRV